MILCRYSDITNINDKESRWNICNECNDCINLVRESYFKFHIIVFIVYNPGKTGSILRYQKSVSYYEHENTATYEFRGIFSAFGVVFFSSYFNAWCMLAAKNDIFTVNNFHERPFSLDQLR